MRLVWALLLIGVALATAEPAMAASCFPAGTPSPQHPSLVALPDAYWRSVPAWADLTAGERDLLARVSIVQRNIRALQRNLVFSDHVPAKVVSLQTAPGEQFVADGAPKLDALVTAARAFMRSRDLRSWFVVSDGFRSYETQR
ncbi:MAG: hypothetical protein JO348_07705, partial [Alphaproteobacteria bacterium]|nr:hypothetical protein [Alphaproteobacteria bacterium]